MSEPIKQPADLFERDALLVRSFQEGDKTAFDQLVNKHKARLFNLCYWFLGDYEEANDSAQETFIKVYRSLTRFRFESAFSTWLYRIAVNTCKNKLKSSHYRHTKQAVRLENPGQPHKREAPMEIRDEAPSPLMEIEKKEKAALMRQAINSLPPEQKEVVALRDIEGFSYDAIAEITGLNLGTLKSRLARARLSLREKLRSVL